MSDLEKIEDVVSEHAVSIALMTRAVSSIENLLTQQTESIKEIEKAMNSQELLMEKLSNLDSRMSDSITRLHSRINKNEGAIEAIRLDQTTACNIVRPMAEKGARIHTGMVAAAKTLGISTLVMLFFLLIWAIKASNYTPQG